MPPRSLRPPMREAVRGPPRRRQPHGGRPSAGRSPARAAPPGERTDTIHREIGHAGTIRLEDETPAKSRLCTFGPSSSSSTPPLRLELFERNARSGMRADLKAPYAVTCDTFTNLVQLAKKLQSSSSGAVGYGLSSKPVTNMNQDAWHTPAEPGLKEYGVSVHDMSPTCSAPCASWGSLASPQTRVIETAQEITYRPVVNNVESEEEQVSTCARTPLRLELVGRHRPGDHLPAGRQQRGVRRGAGPHLRTDPLRLECFGRHSRDKMRLDTVSRQLPGPEAPT